jgi:hypothetical protein
MDYLQRSCKRTRSDGIQNEIIREMGKDIADKVQKQQLTWFGHTNKMHEVANKRTRMDSTGKV